MNNDSSNASDDVPHEGPVTEARFAELFRQCYPLLWGIALGMTGNRADAEDVVQESVLIGLRKRGDYREGTRFGAWMSAIVRHVANNQRRKTTRHRHHPLQDQAIHDQPSGSPGSLQDAREGVVDADRQAFDDRLFSALQSLSPIARACLLLRTLHEMDYQSIAELMDIPKNTALSHVHRSRQSLRELLIDQRHEAGPTIGGTS